MSDKADRIHDYLEDMEKSATRVGKYTADMTLMDFVKNDMCMAAVVREIEIMGEASKRIRDAKGERHPKDSPWTGVLKMRDHVIHQYDGVDPEVVWEVVQNDLPELRRVVAEELAKLDSKTPA